MFRKTDDGLTAAANKACINAYFVVAVRMKHSDFSISDFKFHSLNFGDCKGCIIYIVQIRTINLFPSSRITACLLVLSA